VPEVLFRRRIHATNNSRLQYDEGRTFLDIARSHLQTLRDQAAPAPDSGG
jgi:hypothetical protein